ncbi:MAG: hypothetical protein LC656_07665 [Sphingomonadales bacterium]|nr:hypothetical protein [Sphingomonadales bacterium]
MQYETVARLVELIQSGKIKQAKSLVSEKVQLNMYQGSPRQLTFTQFARYIPSCPIESMDANKGESVTVYFSCPENPRQASFSFSRKKIATISWGEPLSIPIPTASQPHV